MKEGDHMDYSLIWKSIMIVFGGTILLRIAGRRHTKIITNEPINQIETKKTVTPFN